MTLTTPYSATFQVGDGETKEFPYLFEEVSSNFIDVIVYNTLTGISSTPTYTVDTDQKQVIFGDDTPAPTADEVVCISRSTPVIQDVQFRTLHGYDAKTMENILSKIVAMIQEIESKYLTTDVLQGDPWQIDLLSSADDGATLNIDYTAKKFVKGLYFRITNGNLQVSTDGSTYITMPKSADISEFRQFPVTDELGNVEYKLQYRVAGTWFDAAVYAESIAEEALQTAKDAKDTANDAMNLANSFDERITKNEDDIADIISGGNIDNTTITTNNNNKWEVQAVMNRNTAIDATQPIYDWIGTQQEYIDQDVATLHPEWVCFITDDAYNPQSTYAYEQGVSATTWNIVHNLNKYPSVTVVDSAGTTIDCIVTYINSNECELKFNAAFKGTAYLN